MRVVLDAPQPIENLRKVYNDKVTFVTTVSKYPLIDALEFNGDYLGAMKKRAVPVRVGKQVDKLIAKYEKRLRAIWKKHQRAILKAVKAPTTEVDKADAPTLAQVLAESDPSRQAVLRQRYLKARQDELIKPEVEEMKEDLKRAAVLTFTAAYLLGKQRGQILTNQEIDDELGKQDRAILDDRLEWNDEYIDKLSDETYENYQETLEETFESDEDFLAAFAKAQAKEEHRLSLFAATAGSILLAAGMTQAMKDIQAVDPETGEPTGEALVDEETGLPLGDVQEGGIWHTSHDERVCEGCEANDGLWMTIDDHEEEQGTNDCLTRCRCVELFEPAERPTNDAEIWSGEPGIDKVTKGGPGSGRYPAGSGGASREASVSEKVTVINSTDKYNLHDIDNRRFIFLPDTKEMVLGAEGVSSPSGLKGTHDSEYASSGAKGDLDSGVKGWVGTSTTFPDGVIHFAPPLSAKILENTVILDRAIDTLKHFIANGGSEKTAIVGLGEHYSRGSDWHTLGDLFPKLDTTKTITYSDLVKGGPGSGHFGHAGIPGQVGGSAPGEGGAGAPTAERRASPAVEQHFGQDFSLAVNKEIEEAAKHLKVTPPIAAGEFTDSVSKYANDRLILMAKNRQSEIESMNKDLRRYEEQKALGLPVSDSWISGLKEGIARSSGRIVIAQSAEVQKELSAKLTAIGIMVGRQTTLADQNTELTRIHDQLSLDWNKAARANDERKEIVSSVLYNAVTTKQGELANIGDQTLEGYMNSHREGVKAEWDKVIPGARYAARQAVEGGAQTKTVQSRKNYQDGRDWIKANVSPELLNRVAPVEWQAKRGNRSFYHPYDGTIKLAQDDRPGTIPHEFMHHMERQLPEIKTFFQEYYVMRTPGETPVRLSKIQPGHEYKSYEYTRVDKWATPYMGHTNIQRGQEQGSGGEIFSSAVGMLATHRNAAELYRKDPELFGITMSVLKGRIPKREPRV